MKLELSNGAFTVDASVLSRLLNLCPSDVQVLLRDSQITGICERGEQGDAGRHRLTFFYKGRRARLTVDPSGKIVHQAVIDLGERRISSSNQQTRRKGGDDTPESPERG